MSSSSGPHIVLLDLYASGHHRSYIEMLVDRWLDRGSDGRLTVAVSSEFCTRHRPFVERIRAANDHRLELLEFEPVGGHGTDGFMQVVGRGRDHARIAEPILEQLRPDHLLLMYLDPAQQAVPGLARDAERYGTRLSGIYFRPTFHYASSGLRARIKSFMKRHAMRRAVLSGRIHRLFCLDPYVVDTINDWVSDRGSRVAVALPDGTTQPRPGRERATQRRLWDSSPDDVVFLLFGSISRRKGVFALLDALPQLRSDVRRRALFVFAGSILSDDERDIVSRIRSLPSDIRITIDDRFVDDSEMASFFEACDVVLAPYVGHVGSSNVVIRAASAKKPVIGTSSGLVGRLIRGNELGLAVNPEHAGELAQAIDQVTRDASSVFDPSRATVFAAANAPERYADTIFDSLDVMNGAG